MRVGTQVLPSQTLPDRLVKAIQAKFPKMEIHELRIRHYRSVEDVGYEYYIERILPSCQDCSAVHYLAPFISYIRLGEALVLDTDQDKGLVVYESDENDRCTETGPFWLVTTKSSSN